MHNVVNVNKLIPNFIITLLLQYSTSLVYGGTMYEAEHHERKATSAVCRYIEDVYKRQV